MVLDTLEEVFSSEHLDLEVVPKGPPKVASIQIILDLGQVSQEEGERLLVQNCPAITSVVSIHKNSRGFSNQTGNCISSVLLRQDTNVLVSNLLPFIIISSHIYYLLMIDLVTISRVALMEMQTVCPCSICHNGLLDFGCDLIGPSLGKPGINPGLKVDIPSALFLKTLLQTVDEILQSRSLKSELSEVDLDALSHYVSTDEDVNLLQKAGTLTVANLVVVVNCVVRVIHGNLDRVRGTLGVVIESFPEEVKTNLVRILDILKALTFCQADHGAVFSEALL